MGSFTHSIKGRSMVLGWNRCYGLQPLMTALKLYVFFWCNLLELCFIKVLKVDVVVDSNWKFNLSRIQNPTCLMLIDYLPGPCNNISPFSGLSPVVAVIFTLITYLATPRVQKPGDKPKNVQSGSHIYLQTFFFVVFLDFIFFNAITVHYLRN